MGAYAPHLSLLSPAPSSYLPGPSQGNRPRRHSPPQNNLLVPILRMSFQKGKSWKTKWQTTALPASSFSSHEAAETFPHNLSPREEVGGQPAPDPSLAVPVLRRLLGPSLPFSVYTGRGASAELKCSSGPFVCFQVKLQVCSWIFCKFHISSSVQGLCTNP